MPLGWIFRQRFKQHCIQFRSNRWIDFDRWDGLLLHLRNHQRQPVGAIEEFFARQHFIENCSSGIDVRSRIWLSMTPHLLRRHVMQRAYDLAGTCKLIVAERFCNPKVSQFDVPVVVDDQIAWSDVPVDDSLTVRIFEG